MNPAETKSISPAEIDASCRVPLLALFGGAALWLVLGLGLGLAAMLSFHAPNMFADCPFLTYGRAQAAANDLLLYGFVIPAALGVMLWIFARLSQAPLALPIVPVAAANLWHVGVLLGTGAILAGQSTGYPWLEYPRAAAVLLFAGFMLTAVSAVATMGFRRDREMHPAHWFLFASLLWFVWSYSTANLFLLSAHPPRGVVQAVVAWWFGNNLLFVWLALAGVGMAFYFLPKFAGKPLAGTGYALFAFLTLIISGAWCGIPRSAPVPAWLPALGTYAAMLAIIPVLAIAIIAWRTISGSGFSVTGGPNCFVRFGILSFVLSALLYLGAWCPRGKPNLGPHLVRFRRVAVAVARFRRHDALGRHLSYPAAHHGQGPAVPAAGQGECFYLRFRRSHLCPAAAGLRVGAGPEIARPGRAFCRCQRGQPALFAHQHHRPTAHAGRRPVPLGECSPHDPPVEDCPGQSRSRGGAGAP